jgi:two-component system chemotaxis response regulator CheB
VTCARPTVTRVLVIDDSVRVRRTVTRALAREPGIEVVAAMGNGRAAITRSQRLAPDVVLLDAEVAGDGDFPTLRELRRSDPTLRVVMRGDGEPLDEQQVHDRVLPRIHGRLPARSAVACAQPAPPVGPTRASQPSPVTAAPTSDGSAPERVARVRAIAIAASTGGPDVLEQILRHLPETLPVPVFIVQHMPPGFTRLLAERLDRRSRLQVGEAVADELVADGHVYVAPGGYHLALQRVADVEAGVGAGAGAVRIVTHHGPRENSCRPAADVLFRAAADVYGTGLVALVLTGMGHDGCTGAGAVQRAGGRVLVQSEETALISSMPAAVAGAGLADAILDLADIGPRLSALALGEATAWV